MRLAHASTAALCVWAFCCSATAAAASTELAPVTAAGGPGAATLESESPEMIIAAASAAQRAGRLIDAYDTLEIALRQEYAIAWSDEEELGVLDEAIAAAAAVQANDAAVEFSRRAQLVWRRRGRSRPGLEDEAEIRGGLSLVKALVRAGSVLEAEEVLTQMRFVAERAHAPYFVMRELTSLRSGIVDCAGDAQLAVELFESTLPHEKWPPADLSLENDAVSEGTARVYLQLLLRAAADGGANTTGQVSTSAAIATRRTTAAERLTTALLALSGEEAAGTRHKLQVPSTFVPGLAARPWHSIPDHFPKLAPIEELLRGASASLTSEFAALAAGGHLLPETECIVSSGGGWRYFTINERFIRKEEADAEGCSLLAPAACALLRAVRAAAPPGIAFLRAGYSAVAPGSRLRSHFGFTNAALKFHLGLTVPKSAAGEPCAALTVGNETRRWEEGQVLFFDDSWLHEVDARACEEERVIFQLVFSHPDLGAAPGGPRSGPIRFQGAGQQRQQQRAGGGRDANRIVPSV